MNEKIVNLRDFQPRKVGVVGLQGRAADMTGDSKKKKQGFHKKKHGFQKKTHGIPKKKKRDSKKIELDYKKIIIGLQKKELDSKK